MEFLVNLVSKVTPAKLYSAKFTCELAITKYRDSDGEHLHVSLIHLMYLFVGWQGFLF